MHVQSDTLLLVDAFEKFRNMCLKIYELNPAKCFSAPGLAWQAALRKTKVKLDLLTDINMLLIIEKGIKSTLFINMQANNKYMKNYYENKESLYLQYWDVNNLYGWAMSQKFPVNSFEWIEDTFQFNDDFIKN